MVRTLLALLLLAGPALAQAPPPKAPPPAEEARQPLVVRNGTATVLQRLHLNTPGAERPGPDLLGQGVLRPGETFRASLRRPPECRMELRAVFGDRTEERRALDLCSPASVEFTDAALLELELVNESDAELREVYLVPPGGPRGPDRLGASVVPALDALALRLRGFPHCAVEAQAVFRAPAPREARAVDLCRERRLVFGDPSVPLREATLRNGTGTVLRELYLRGAGEGGGAAWGADRLGAAVLEPGQGFLLRTRRAACRVDLRAVFAGGREELREGLDICALREVAFLPGRRTTLVHQHARPVREVYLSAATEADWGPDLLAGRPLARGESREVGMEGGCEADLRIVFDNGNAEEMRGFDLCRRPEIVLRPGWVAE